MLRCKVLSVDFQKAISSAGLLVAPAKLLLKQSWMRNGNVASVQVSLSVFQLVTRCSMLKNKELMKKIATESSMQAL